MQLEEQLVREYFGDPKGDHTEDVIMKTDRMMEHMQWHELSENKRKTGTYGERFLLFHKEYIEKFDTFRISKGLLPVSLWDPSILIPPRLAHEVSLMVKMDCTLKVGTPATL